MSTHSDLRIAIIGAGISGSVAARVLCDQGFDVTIFDKSRGTGGRMAAARLADESVDLGVPFLEPGGDAFNGWLEHCVSEGMLREWYPASQSFAGDLLDSPKVYAAPGRLSQLTRSLISGCTLQTQKRISLVWPSCEGVSLRDDDNRLAGEFDVVLIATPAPQAALLLDAVGRFRSRASAVKMQPVWLTAFALRQPLNTPMELLMGDHPSLSRLVRDSAKPGKQGVDRWVAEATMAWSGAHRRDNPDYIQKKMLAAIDDLLGPLPEMLEVRTHRWLYCHALPDSSLPCLWGEDVKVGVCGDWFGIGGAEGAFNSGLALAEKVLQSLSAEKPSVAEEELAC